MKTPGGAESLVDYAEFFLDCREEKKKYKEHLLRAVRVTLDFTVASFTEEFSQNHLLGKTGRAS